jgi:hypothetical protein
MTETFACPECGDEVTLTGATPGRQVRCARCETWVEVPYLPRAGVWTRPRFRRKRPTWVIPLAWTSVALLAAIVAILVGSRVVATRSHAVRESTVAEILDSADLAEKSGRTSQALSEVEAAITLLRASPSEESDRLSELTRRRDRLSVREAEERLAASARLEPSDAVGDLLTLQARARRDPALGSMTSAISAAIEAARSRLVQADLDAARSALDGGRHLDALALGERALVVADKLGAESSKAAVAEAEALMAPILGRIGVIVVQTPGQYTLGSAEAYDASLGPIIGEGLRRQGFAPRPPRGPAKALWDRHAAYQLNFQVHEAQDSLYLQSKSRVSAITASLTLSNASGTNWSTRITGKTQVPLPDLPAYVGSRLAVSDHRDPDTERRLYENARTSMLDMVGFNLKGIPPR